MSNSPEAQLESAQQAFDELKLQTALNEAELALADLEVDMDAQLRAKAHELAGSAALNMGRYAVAEEHLRQAMVLLHEQGEEQRALNMQLQLVEALLRQGNLLSSRHLAQLALESARNGNWRPLVARGLMCLGNLAWVEGNVAEAYTMLSQATEIFDDLQLLAMASRARCALAVAKFMAGETESAIALLQQSLLHFQQSRDFVQVARCLNNLAGIHFQNHDYARAREYLLQCVDLEAEQGARGDMVSAWFNLSLIELGEGNFKLANKYLHRTLQLARETGDRNREGAALLHLGIISLLDNEISDAQNYAHLAASSFQGSPSQHARSFRIYHAIFLLAGGRFQEAQQAWNLPESERNVIEDEKRMLVALLVHLTNHYNCEDETLKTVVRRQAAMWLDELTAGTDDSSNSI